MKRLSLISGIGVALAFIFLWTWSYAAVLFSYDFGFKYPGKNDWDIKNFASGVKPIAGAGYMELKGNIQGQQGEQSQYVFLSRIPLKQATNNYEITLKMSFSGDPKKRLSEEEEYQAAKGMQPKSESKWGGGNVSSGAALRPPCAVFGVSDAKGSLSAFFKVEPQEVYVAGGKSEKAGGILSEKVKDIEEAKWHTYKLVMDSNKKALYFYVDGALVYTLNTYVFDEGFVFFGVNGDEGAGTKTVHFARFDELLTTVQ